jgi:hypothetical protein
MSVANGTFTRTNLGQQDGSNHPRFYLEQVEDHVASANAGRLIARDEERVEIIMPGNPHTRPVARVTDEHRQKWPREYEAFKAGIEISPEGTPLEEWPILKRSQVMELKWLGFRTVEHIRDMDDQAIQRIGMGGRRLKELAGVFLDDAERMAVTSRMSAENEKLTDEVAMLRRQVAEMGELTQKTFAELQTMKNAPSPLLTHIPGMSDPVELAKVGQHVEVATSSLDNIGGSRRRRAASPVNAELNEKTA